jgi:hypothetical protein
MSAAPISASRCTSTPVNANAEPGDLAGDVVLPPPPVDPVPPEPSVVEGLVDTTLPPVEKGWLPDRLAPAAGFAMNIAGAIHAAAPAAMPVETPLRSARRVMRAAGITRPSSLWAGSLEPVGSLFIADSSAAFPHGGYTHLHMS